MSEEDYPETFDPADELPNQSEEIQAIARKFAHLRANNQRIQQQLQASGATLDIASARVEFIMAQLITLGLLTHEQYWQMQFDWQVNLRKQLSAVREQQNALRDRVLAQQRQQRQTLLVPDHVVREKQGRSKIVLPGEE